MVPATTQALHNAAKLARPRCARSSYPQRHKIARRAPGVTDRLRVWLCIVDLDLHVHLEIGFNFFLCQETGLSYYSNCTYVRARENCTRPERVASELLFPGVSQGHFRGESSEAPQSLGCLI